MMMMMMMMMIDQTPGFLLIYYIKLNAFICISFLNNRKIKYNTINLSKNVYTFY